MERERGYTVCTKGKRGRQVVGEPHSVSIPVECPAGSRPRGLFHTHPGGSLQPSVQDMQAAHQHNLPVCIRVRSKVKCYPVNRGSRKSK